MRKNLEKVLITNCDLEHRAPEDTEKIFIDIDISEADYWKALECFTKADTKTPTQTPKSEDDYLQTEVQQHLTKASSETSESADNDLKEFECFTKSSLQVTPAKQYALHE